MSARAQSHCMFSRRGLDTRSLKNLVSAVMSDNSAGFLRLYLGVVSYHLDLTCFITMATVKYIGETAVYHDGALRCACVYVTCADLLSGKPGTRSPWRPYVKGRRRPCFRLGPYLLPLGARSPANFFLCTTPVPNAARVHKTMRTGPGGLLLVRIFGRGAALRAAPHVVVCVPWGSRKEDLVALPDGM